jgi:thiamine biosynthesis lipoprotein
MRHVEHAMGTAFSFDVRRGAVGRRAETAAVERACAALHDADETFSLYKPDSPMSRIRRGELTVEQAPRDVAVVLERCAEARDLSDGWFDPWALPGGVDPTGLVKGWATQRAAGILQNAGLAAAMVNGAGDIACFGQPEPGRPWTVGIVDPHDATRIAVSIPITAAVATSGTTERGEHIYDVQRRRYAAQLISVTVTGPDLAIADALATATAARGREGIDAVNRGGLYAALAITG